MKRICFFDTKPYDRIYFDQMIGNYPFTIDYFESRLRDRSAALTKGYDGVIAFVNDQITESVLCALQENGIGILALRSAGFNNVDMKSACGKIKVVRVPEYSPYAVAEHAMALLLTLNRKTHKAYNRVRDYNFSLSGLIGVDMFGKTAGVIGTGKIGVRFIEICKGFGMRVLAYDPYPKALSGVEYVSLDELAAQSDVISLHCPLTKDTHHIIGTHTLSQMKPGAVVVNTSRGALVDSEALLNALKEKRIAGAALDVYEEESELFFEDHSFEIIQDEILSQIIALPNVVLTSHQAFLTHEALKNIAEVTLNNLRDYFDGKPLVHEVKLK